MHVKPSSRIGKVETYYFATKLAQIAEMRAAGKDILNLGIGSPDLPPPPQVIHAMHEASKDPNVNGYQSYRGIPELREAKADFMLRQFNVRVNPKNEILPLIGSKEGIMHLAMAFLEEGDQVLIPNPGYPAYRMTTLLAGAEAVPYELGAKSNWLPNLEDLERVDLSRVKLMWINYPHMPTGAQANMEFFQELIAFAHRHQILICHDNPYNFVLNEAPMSILQVEGAKEVCIELHSMSKAYNMAGWRIGFMLGNEAHIGAVMKFKSNMDSGMYLPIQKGAAEALNLDEEWFDVLNERYKLRRKIVWEIMDLLGCEYQKDQAGLFVWAKKPKRIKEVEPWVESILQQAHVFLTPGFIFGTAGADYIRISLCNSRPVLEEALKRIQQFQRSRAAAHSS